jgi:broad specificity phosphatase PhoE
VGDFAGLPLGIVDDTARQNKIALRKFVLPNGENWIDVQRRAGSVFERVTDTYYNPEDPKRVLIVAHGGWIMELMNYLREKKMSKPALL